MTRPQNASNDPGEAALHNQTDCIFFTKLPREIRERIYGHILPEHAAVDLDGAMAKGNAMALVSRQCREEYKLEYYKRNVFFVRLRDYSQKKSQATLSMWRWGVTPEHQLTVPRVFRVAPETHLAALRRVWVYYKTMRVMVTIRLLRADQAAIDRGLQAREVTISARVLETRRQQPAIDSALERVSGWERAWKARCPAHTLLTSRTQWVEMMGCIVGAANSLR